MYDHARMGKGSLVRHPQVKTRTLATQILASVPDISLGSVKGEAHV